MLDILFIWVVYKKYYLEPTCNSKLQIIKFSFFLVGSPKKVGYPNFKNSYLFNRKEPRDVPPTVGNGTARAISPWWVYFQSHGPIPLKYSICSGCQRPHTWRCKRPYHQLQEFQSLLQHIKALICRNSAIDADTAYSSTLYGTSIEQNTTIVYPFPRWLVHLNKITLISHIWMF